MFWFLLEKNSHYTKNCVQCFQETDELKIRQECLNDAHQFRGDLDHLQRQIKGARLQYEALERENHILQITLQQRDEEIKHQKDMVE